MEDNEPREFPESECHSLFDQEVGVVALGVPHNHTTRSVWWLLGFHRGKRNCAYGKEHGLILCLPRGSNSNTSIGRSDLFVENRCDLCYNYSQRMGVCVTRGWSAMISR